MGGESPRTSTLHEGRRGLTASMLVKDINVSADVSFTTSQQALFN